jgi:DivIVA domain-containing protein
MESKTHGPSFTVSLRGYDRMEVDEYLDSLAEALGQVEQAEERNSAMQAHVDRLNARIADLEERIRSEVPRSGAVLGERISILLRSAEETAADTVYRAEAAAAEILDKAHQEVESAEDQARGAVVRGEEQAAHIESAARAEAAEIMTEAETRASARTRQIEQWAEQVVSHTRAEEARMLAEQQEKRQAAEAELRALEEQRDAVAATLAELRETLGQALGLVGTVAAPTVGPVVETAAEVEEADGGGADMDRVDMEGVDIEGVDMEASEVEASESMASGGDGPADWDPDHEDPEQEEAQHELRLHAVALDESEVEADEEAEELPWPAAFHPHAGEAEDDRAEADQTGEMISLVVEPEAAADDDSVGDEEPDEFETKFEAWVSGTGEPKHFRRL